MSKVQTSELKTESNYRGNSLWSKVSLKNQSELEIFLQNCGQEEIQALPTATKNIPNRFSESKLAFFDLANQDKVLEHSLADKVIKVETGITIKSLQEYLSAQGEWWPCQATPASKTLFDVIADGDAGFYEHGFGGPRHLVLGLDVVTAAGNAIKCGGRVVKNVTGYDLVKLFVGSHNTLGIPCAAYLRLYSLPEAQTSLFCSAPNFKQGILLAQKLLASGLGFAACELFSAKTLADGIKGASDRNFAKYLQSLKTSGAQACFLLLQIHGHGQTVKQTQNQTSKLLAENGGKAAVIEEEHEKNLWQLLANQAEGDFAMQVACEQALSGSFLDNLSKSKLKALWQMRPSSSRLRLNFANMDAVDEGVKLLASISVSENKSCLIAYPSKEFALKIATLPQEDPIQNALKASLKKKFDPKNILNPVVSL